MARELLPVVIFMAITSTALGDVCATRTSNLVQVSVVRSLDNAPFAGSLRDDTSVVHVVIGSQEENSFLDLVIEMYSNSVPVIVQKLGRKYWSQSSESGLDINAIDFVLGSYDTTAQINVGELELAFGSMWSPRARIILWVCEEVIDRSLNKIFKDFWAHDVLNVDLVAQDSSTGSWKVFTYNPFVIGDDGAKGSVQKIAANGQELFPDKLANLHNHSISISVFDQSPTTMMTDDFQHLNTGPDTEFLRIISQEMNFNIDLKTANSSSISYATTLKNNKRTGVLGDIINGRSEVVWNRQYIDDLPTEYIEFTYPRHTVKTCIIVRKADLIPMTIRAILPFPLVIWLGIFTAMGVLLILMTLAKEKDIFPRMIRLLLFQNFSQIPERNFNRVYSISWILWALLLIVIYQANLVKDLMFPRYYKDIDTPQDLYDRNMTLFVGQNTFKVVNHSEIGIWRQLADRTEVELNFTRCVNRMIGNEAVACASREFIANFMPMAKIFRDENGPKLHRMKKHLSDHWEAFMVKRGLPYLDKFDNFIVRLVEGGVYKKWITPILTWYIMRKPTYYDTVLTMKHIKGLLCIFFIGIAMSTFAFVLEICYGNFCRTNHG